MALPTVVPALAAVKPGSRPITSCRTPALVPLAPHRRAYLLPENLAPIPNVDSFP